MTESVLKELLHVEQLIVEDENKKALELVKKISKRDELSSEDKLACTLLESRIYINLDEREKALKQVDKIWPAIRKQENLILILDYMIIKTNDYWNKGELDNGIKLFEEHLDLIAELQPKVPKDEEKRFKLRKCSFLRNGGILYWYKGELDTSLVYHKQSLALGEEINSKISISNSLNNLGLVYWSKGDIDKSIEYYNRALSIIEELGIKRRAASILTNLGNAYTMKGDLDKALESQQRSLEIKKKFSNNRDIAISLINVGVIFQLKGELDLSLDYYQKGLQLSEVIDSKLNIALALNNIGNIYDLRGNPDSAIEYYKRSLKIYKELGIKEKIALLLVNIGSNCSVKGNIDEALDNFNQSLTIYEELGNKLGSSIVLLELVQEALKQNDQDLIQEYLKKLQQINKSVNIRSFDKRYRLAKALSLKLSDESRNKTRAIVLFEQIIEEEILDHSITVKAMIHLSDMLIAELKQTAEIKLLKEIKDLVQKLQEIAEEQKSNSILAEIYRFEALLALAELDLKETRLLLQKGLNVAEENGLESIASNIREEQKRLDEQIKLWEELQKRKAPLKETLQHVKIEESCKQLQNEELVANRKLFSLKL
ncbi:MAG: tetratricopeptide repeat protein [Asgard group archaeon]|nr:tetratricopeptide repeat protein [Asgard group archaeon]